MLVAAVDSDSIVYACGFAAQKTWYYVYEVGIFDSIKDAKEAAEKSGAKQIFKSVEPEPIENCLHSVKLQLQKAHKAVEERFGRKAELRVFLTGSGNFRDRIATIRPYKGNRTADKPVHMAAIRDYMVRQWGAQVIWGYEADDEVSILQTELGDDCVVCGIDKDLLQVPGWHYVPEKGFKKVSASEGLLRFYAQVLSGDTTDNVPGCYKVGRKIAVDRVKACGAKPDKLWELAVDSYTASIVQYGVDACGYEDPEAAALETARLVWMLRYRPQWNFETGMLAEQHLWSPDWDLEVK